MLSLVSILNEVCVPILPFDFLGISYPIAKCKNTGSSAISVFVAEGTAFFLNEFARFSAADSLVLLLLDFRGCGLLI